MSSNPEYSKVSVAYHHRGMMQEKWALITYLSKQDAKKALLEKL